MNRPRSANRGDLRARADGAVARLVGRVLIDVDPSRSVVFLRECGCHAMIGRDAAINVLHAVGLDGVANELLTARVGVSSTLPVVVVLDGWAELLLVEISELGPEVLAS